MLLANFVCSSSLKHTRKGVAHMAKIPDFDLRDIAAPEPHRTRSHLSGFINLIRFIEEQEPHLASIRSRSSALVQDRERVAKASLEVQQKTSTIRHVQLLSLTFDADTFPKGPSTKSLNLDAKH
jgi:kinetochore protein Nuf2